MSAYEVTTGLTVRMTVDWFKEKPFQDWFNSRLGLGLATWNPSMQLLGYMGPGGCAAQAVLLSEVRGSRLIAGSEAHLFDGSKGPDTEAHRLARKTIETLEQAFKKGASGRGIAHETLSVMADELMNNVINQDVFSSPSASGVSQEEFESQKMCLADAKRKLNELYEMLKSAPDCEDMAAYCDCFVGVDPGLNGEGTDSDMPEQYWDVIVKNVRDLYRGLNDGIHIVVWLTPAG